MRADFLLACISGPLLAVFLLEGKGRCLLAAFAGGMLSAFLCGSISGCLAKLVEYDAMAAVLYISPAVEEGIKLILFLLFLYVWQLSDDALPAIAVSIGSGFAMLEIIALEFSAESAGTMALFARALCSTMIHVACALILIFAVRMVRGIALEPISGLLGVYAVTITVHALYNLMYSYGGVIRILGYCLPAILIVAWKAGEVRKKANRGENDAGKR